ncbi:MAG: hypothetical protein HY859_04765 [Caulobacterales bacterium]|nr:hypothetical protein [Caulobacterales bacterium]
MIAEIKTRIAAVLLEAEPAIKILTEAEAEAQYDRTIPAAVILAGQETAEPDGSVVAKSTLDGVRSILRKKYARKLPLRVMIHAAGEAGAEALYEELLAGISPGIHDANGHFCRLEKATCDFVDDRDKLRQGSHADIQLEFSGGVYRVETATLLTAVEATPE